MAGNVNKITPSHKALSGGGKNSTYAKYVRLPLLSGHLSDNSQSCGYICCVHPDEDELVWFKKKKKKSSKLSA